MVACIQGSNVLTFSDDSRNREVCGRNVASLELTVVIFLVCNCGAVCASCLLLADVFAPDLRVPLKRRVPGDVVTGLFVRQQQAPHNRRPLQ